MHPRLRAIALPCLAALAACSTVTPRPDQVSPPLPKAVPLKTGQEAITPDYLFALREGRLFVKPNPDAGESGDWRPIGDGLPDKWYWATRPAKLARITADGSYLVAEGEDGIFYSLRWGTGYITGWGTLVAVGKGQFVWSRDWDFPLKPFTDPLRVNVPGLHDFSFSNRTKYNVGYYEDANGYHHWLDFGCDTFFALGADGSLVHYADPWLPDGFQRKLAAPNHGRTPGIALSAAASTILLMDRAGRLWTRMFDFDIAGEDFYFFKYTWADADSGYLRVRLPLPDWKQHEPVPGKTTTRITLVTVPKQEGNAARELRVEGVDADGKTGYWAKGIAATEWKFVPTGDPLSGPLLEPTQAPGTTGESARYDVPAKGKLDAAEVVLEDFNTVSWQPAKLTVGTTTLTMHTHELRLDPKEHTATMRGALLLPDPAAKATLPAGLAKSFADRPYVPIRLNLEGNKLRIRPDESEDFDLTLESATAILLD